MKAICKSVSDSSVCGLHAGDVIAWMTFLYGMMMRSGNDLCDCNRKSISRECGRICGTDDEQSDRTGGDTVSFCRQTDFRMKIIIPLYDLYLIFRAALQNENICPDHKHDFPMM